MVACPICKKNMKEEKRDGVTIDICPEHGVWLDKGELHELIENNRVSLSWWENLFHQRQYSKVDDNRVLQCPKCNKDMILENYLSVQIDWCPDHGIWLDQNELEMLLNNIKADDGYIRGMSLRLWEQKY